jgi:hypothetical protein
MTTQTLPHRILAAFVLALTWLLLFVPRTSSGQDFFTEEVADETSSEIMTGYTSKLSVFAGDQVHFKTSTVADSFSATVMRFGQRIDTLFVLEGLPGLHQDIPDSVWKVGCGWQTTFSVVIPEDAKSGIYSAYLKDSNGEAIYVTFVVKPAVPPSAAIAVLASTNTWNAYNAWGGKSFYVPSDDYATFLSFERPNRRANPVARGINHLTRAELWVLGWLEKNGYAYDLYADGDLHADTTLFDGYQTVILNTHPEYWSAEMLDGLERFLNRGGNLLYLGGNGLYWKTTFDSTGTVMEVRKDRSVHAQTGEQGGLWSAVGRPQARYLGVRYTSAGYNTWAAFRVANADHWVFEGTGLVAGSRFGFLGFNGGGASGWETDKIDPENSPANLVLLAKGENPNGGGADMVYYDHPGGGFVFSASSMSFGGTFIRYQNMQQMMHNLLRGRPTSVAERPSRALPGKYRLLPNYPNPFNTGTRIEYELGRPQEVRVTVYDLRGTAIRVLVREWQKPGMYRVRWDGRDTAGRKVASGVYLYRLETSEAVLTRKLLVVR